MDLSVDYLCLYSSLIDDLYTLYPKTLPRGIKKYLTNRVKNEGFSFLGIVLPELSARFLCALDTGIIPCNFYSCVSKSSPLGLIIQRGFRGCTNSVAIFLQLCNFFKKVVTNNDQVEADTINKFVSKNRSRLEVQPRAYFNNYVEAILRYVVVPELDSEYKDTIEKGNLYFRDGPGSTSPIGRSSLTDDKALLARANSDFFSAKRGYPLDPFLKGTDPVPFSDYINSLEFEYHAEFERQYKESFPESLGLMGSSPHATIVCVPKSFTSKRIIAKDNVYAVRRQMALMDIGYRAIKKLFPRNDLKDQSLNQRLARIGSCTKDYITVDIKDGSNTVPYHVVKEWFKDSLYFRMFWHVRTTRYVLPDTHPDGDVIVPLLSKKTGKPYLTRFSSESINMAFSQGSPGCFLTLVLYMSVISAASVLEHFCLTNGVDVTSLSSDNIVTFFNRYIRCTDGPSPVVPFAWYGDDGILRHTYYRHFLAFAKEYGAEINVEKTFVNSFLRESCGPYYYRGANITPIKPSFYCERIHHNLFTLKDSDDILVKYASICEKLRDSGLFATFEYLYTHISGHTFSKENSRYFNDKRWRKLGRRFFNRLFLFFYLLCLDYKLWLHLSPKSFSPFSYWGIMVLDLINETQFKFSRYFSSLDAGRPVLISERGRYRYTYDQRLKAMEVCKHRKFAITPLTYTLKKVRICFVIYFMNTFFIWSPVVVVSVFNDFLIPLKDELVPDVLPTSFVRARSTSVKSY